MADTLVMVGTRKGLWIGRSDEARLDWTWTGPHFAMEEVYSALVDTRGERPRLLAGASSSWLGPQVWRSDDLGETWQETPNGAIRFPEDTGEAVARVWQLTPGAEDGVVYAGTEPGAIFKSTDRGRDVPARARPVGQPAAPGVERRLRGPGVPHDPAPPARAGEGAGRDLDRRRLPHRRRRRLVVPVQHGCEGRVHAGRPQLPGVRPVRAQGDASPGTARAALPAEPRWRLPLRRRRRHLAGHRARAPVGVRVPDRGPPPRPRDGLRLPDRRRRRPLAGRGSRPGVALERRGRALGAARRRRAARPVLRGGDARRPVRGHPRRRRASTSAAATAASGPRPTRARRGRRSTRTFPTCASSGPPSSESRDPHAGQPVAPPRRRGLARVDRLGRPRSNDASSSMSERLWSSISATAIRVTIAQPRIAAAIE